MEAPHCRVATEGDARLWVFGACAVHYEVLYQPPRWLAGAAPALGSCRLFALPLGDIDPASAQPWREWYWSCPVLRRHAEMYCFNLLKSPGTEGLRCILAAAASIGVESLHWVRFKGRKKIPIRMRTARFALHPSPFVLP